MHSSPPYPGAGGPDGAQPPQAGPYPAPQWGPSAPPPGPLPWSPSPQGWWPQPYPPAPRKPRSRGAVVAIVAAAVLAVAVLGGAVAGAVSLGRAAGAGMAGQAAGNPAPSVQPKAPVDPTGLGTDPGFNSLAQHCHDGDMQACDDLYDQSEPMSRYEQYGMTCGGRVKPFDVGYCTDLDGQDQTTSSTGRTHIG